MSNTSSIPSNFICPITQDIMKNPVLLVEDGHSYEKSALEFWLEKHNTSPITNLELKTQTFVVNYNLKSTIEEFSRHRNDTQSKQIFHSFVLHRGRPRIDEWKKHPRLQVIISLLGQSGTGKSCLATNVEYGQPQRNHKSHLTLGVDMFFFYLDRLFEDKYVVIVQIYDCPGNDRFETISDRHFRNCHGAILMVDTTEIKTFERLEAYWYKRLREKSSFDNVEAVLACNKIDLLENNKDPSYHETFFKRADTFVSHHQMPIFNISALRGDNVQKMFHHLILSILQNQYLVKVLKEESMKTEKGISGQTSTIKVTEPPIKSSKPKTKACAC